MKYIDPKAIVREYKVRVISPMFGEGEISKRLEDGLYNVLVNIDTLSIPALDVFTREKINYAKARSAFRELGVKTVGEVARLTEEELLRTPFMGQKTARYIKRELSKCGLHLADDVEVQVVDSTLLSENFQSIFEYDRYVAIRAWGILYTLGAHTLGDVIRFTEDDILGVTRAGKSTLKYIKRELAKHELSLKRSDSQ